MQNLVAIRAIADMARLATGSTRSRMTLNGNRASPDRIHKIPLNVVCDKVPGLLPKSRGPFATWGQAEEPGVAFEGCAEDSVVQR